jgi:hypothetical protein
LIESKSSWLKSALKADFILMGNSANDSKRLFAGFVFAASALGQI